MGSTKPCAKQTVGQFFVWCGIPANGQNIAFWVSDGDGAH